jgi:signal transduction histidine kinase
MLERSLGGRLGDEELYYLKRINANAEGLQKLIADLFAFARSGEDESSAAPVDANAVAAELLLELRDRAEERGMSLVVDGTLPTVRAHPVRLKQALTNLVDNAIRYGGGHVRLSGSHSGNVAQIVVEDGGAGVPPDERDRIFEVFARGKDARVAAPDGTGLGLALVKRIVEASGGDVRYEPGAGARFVLTFPGGAR